MAAIRVIQDIKVDGFALLSVHNPLTFIVEVDYDGLTPDYCDVELLTDSVSLVKLKAIAYQDTAPKTRQFIFVADEIIRGWMPRFEDEVQAADTLIYIENMTREFTVVFTFENLTASIDFVACNASSQFGDIYGACLKDINDPKIYSAGKDGVVYLYIYNWDENNVISMSTDIDTGYALASNLDNFTNNNLDRYLIIN